MLYIATFFLMSKTNSPDLIHDEISKLAEVFPQFVSEGKVDIAWLQSYLDGQTVEGERYNMNRHGKSKAKLIAREPSTATLRPDLSQSKNRDTTGNMLIEWDNLEVLKLLQNHYYESIKCIYIDPPYNKDKDFVYRDTRKDPVGNYMRITGQIDDEWEITTENNETTGRKHSNWLSMMYPRLYLARKLLKDDGVIFVSIDDDEVVNLKKLMDEIFWEENFVAQIVWRRTDNQSNIWNIARVKDYILVYGKNKVCTQLYKLPLSEKAKNEYRYSDEYWFFRRNILLDKVKWRHNYEVITPEWWILNWPRMIKENEFIELSNNWKLYRAWGKIWQPYWKIYLDQKINDWQIPHDFWWIEFWSNQRWSLEVEKLFWARYFDFPKPISLIKSILQMWSKDNDIILDFFAWSWTTWHAVMDINTEDDGNRKYILVQLPEAIGETQEAYKVWYRKISEITRDRLLKAGENISKWDTGFRFFKLDTSNFTELDPITIQEWETTDEQLFDRLSLEADSFGIKTERSDNDIITELLIRYGYSLHSKIEQDSEFPTWYHITDILESENSFFLSLEDSVSDDDIARFVKLNHTNNQIVFMCKDDAISSGSRLTLANYFPGFTTL